MQFKHVDDSLFAVALRNPKITETILNEVGEIHYNLDKTLETLADNNIQKGASHQQYVLTSANRLADYLSNVQSEMNMEMQGQGSGKGKPKPDKVKEECKRQISSNNKKAWVKNERWNETWR